MFDALHVIANGYENFYVFQASSDVETVLADYMKHYRTTCDDFDRPTAYSQFKNLLAYSFDEAHPETVYKEFWMKTPDGDRYAGVSYTLTGEGIGEERVTKEHVAYYNDTTPDKVFCKYAA
jgi:hypothetical protein